MTGRKLGLRKRIGLRLFSDLYAEKIAEHKLRTLFWECTLRCNLACRHCGSDCRVDPGVPDMPLADFLKVLDEEVTPHNRPEDVLLIFSGGEVLVRSDLEEAGREVTRRGYAWGMVTNGLALDADRLRSLMDAGLRSISISFDGFEDAHNYIRRNPRSFEKALDAIRLIVREPRLTYDVITCVTSPMVARLEEFKELLIAEGVKYWRIFSIFPVGRAKDDPTLAVTDAQFREVLEFIKRTRKEGRIDLSYACEGFLGGYEGEVRDDFYQCAGRGFGCLDPGGRGDFGLYLHPGQFPSGEYLPGQFLGRVAESLRQVPRPRMGPQRGVRRLQDVAFLSGRRYAPARRPGASDVLSLQAIAIVGNTIGERLSNRSLKLKIVPVRIIPTEH